MKQLYLYIGFFVFFLSLIPPALSQEYQFRNYTVNEGLAGSQITSFYQDERGSIWMGNTSSQVSIFNSINFKNFSHDDSDFSQRVVSMVREPVSGLTWVGTRSGIFTVNDQLETGNFPMADKLPSNFITDMHMSTDQTIWIGTDKGLCLFKDGQLQTFDNNNGLGSNFVLRFLETGSGDLLVSTAKGIFRYDSGKFTDFSKVIGAGEIAEAILEDSKGGLWIDVEDGLLRYFNGQLYEYSTKTGLSYYDVSAMVEDRFGNFWIALDIGGINKLQLDDNGAAHFQVIGTENGLINTRVYNAFVDREGNLWFGTDAGVSKLSDQKFISFTTANGLPNNYINGIMEDSKGRIWIATAGGGISVYERGIEQRNFSVKTGDLLSPYVLISIEDKHGNIWMGTWGGYVSIFDGDKIIHITDKQGLTVNKCYGLAEDRENDIVYLGLVSGGLGICKKKALTSILTTDDGLVSNNVLVLFMDSKQRLWIGTRNGLSIYENGKFTNFTTENGMPNNMVSDVMEDRSGRIWVSTDRGVGIYDNGQFVKAYTKEHHVSIASYCLEDNDGNVWIGTDKGLTKVSFENGTEKFTVITPKDGLISSETITHSKLKDSKGHLWFGTTHGLSKYLPENLHISNEKPLLYIDKALSSNNTLITENSPVDYIDKNITFHFYGIWFKDEIGLQYSYMLEGFDKDWSKGSPDNHVRYTNLSPGNYSFRVKARNSLNTWSDTQSLKFSIKTPFWLQWWFYVLIAICAIAIVYYAYRLRIRSIEAQKELLEQQVLERTAEINQQKEEIRIQKDLVEEKNQDITDSITYAKRIQEAILPSQNWLSEKFSDSFVLYRPRDIVSGDFYWFSQVGGIIVIAVADCTGHGVPGAFMSMIGNDYLTQIVADNQVTSPSQALTVLDQKVMKALKNNDKDVESNDGMDIGLCAFNSDSMELQYAGAKNSLHILKDGKLKRIKGNNFSIGGHRMTDKGFENHAIKIEKGDCIYLLTDGLPDQFGGPKGKKFMLSKLKPLLIEIGARPMQEQKEIISQTIRDWQGNLQQVDDICIIGVRI